MSNLGKLFAKARRNPNGLRFGDLRTLCEGVGMDLRAVNGSHHVYTHPLAGRPISIQECKGGGAKGYQVKQVVAVIEDNGLMDERE